MKVSSVSFRNIAPPGGECGICFETIKIADSSWAINDVVGHILNVSKDTIHYFHRACIADWFAQAHTCPLCHVPVINFQSFIAGAEEDPMDPLVIAKRTNPMGIVNALLSDTYMSEADRKVAVRVANGLILNHTCG